MFLLGILFCIVGLLYLIRTQRKLDLIPGPWYCKFSRIALTYHEFRGTRTHWIHELHKQYGKVVRIAGNEVHFNDLGALKAIYGTDRGVMKDDFYTVYNHRGCDHIFSVLDIAGNAEKRRSLRGILTPAKLKSLRMQSFFRDAIDELIETIDEAIEQQRALDLHCLFTSFAVTIVASLVYGVHSDTDATKRRKIHLARQTGADPKKLFRKAGLPWLSHVVSLYRYIHDVLRATAIISGFADDKSRRRSCACYLPEVLSSMENVRLLKPISATCMDSGANVWDILKAEHLSVSEILAESRALVIAGSVTSPAALVFMLLRILEDAKLHKLVLKEISATAMDTDQPLDYAGICADVPILSAACSEVLRIYSPIPMTLPRVAAKSMQICGYDIPAGTKIGCQAYSIHRMEELFPKPQIFDHTRYLPKSLSDGVAPARSENTVFPGGSWAFSSGARVCIGQHLAIIQLKLAIIALLTRFDLQIVSSNHFTDLYEWTEDVTSFSIQPKNRVHVLARRRPQ